MSKLKKQFRSIIGYGYGRKAKRISVSRSYAEVAGQDFWELVTGESDFYLRIKKLMAEKPEQRAVEFKEELAKTGNRLIKEFLLHFSTADGSTDWENLTKFNSGAAATKFKEIPDQIIDQPPGWMMEPPWVHAARASSFVIRPQGGPASAASAKTLRPHPGPIVCP
ncbi:MAG: PmeII family type II restriction endonuclease [Verrucomicrobiae bacterium]|nr:PmeII family type II restriction endonuclease [Verrucomicrobiae bacterium]